MKNYFILILCACVHLQIFAQSAYRKEADILKEPGDISEYYLIIPGHPYYAYAEKPKGMSEFELRKKYLEPKKGMQIEIDKKNAFMSISDNTSELGYKMQLTYFVKSDGKKVIAVNEDQAGGDCDSRSLKFYTLENGKFTDVTARVMPSLSLKDFCPEATVSNYSFFEPLYQLPRVGTTVRVSATALCEQDNRGRVSYEEYVRYFQKLKCRQIELAWDKESGKLAVKSK